MALDRLIRALEDSSPEVRRQAARGLGEARSPEAVAPLLDELSDEESDIRSEAAEALGKIGQPEVVDPLLDAFDDPDTRVQISAIRALSEIGGDEVGELVFWKFADRFDRATFPTLADVLGVGGDLRMIRPTLERLKNYRSPAIRLQLLNSVCQALGGGRRFYRLISQEDLVRAQRLEDMIRRTHRAFSRCRVLPTEVRTPALRSLVEIRRGHDVGDTGQLAQGMRTLMDDLEAGIGETTVDSLGTETASRIGGCVLAVRIFLESVADQELAEIQQIFLIVCLWSIGSALEPARRK